MTESIVQGAKVRFDQGPETDLIEELRNFDVPTLIPHGDDHQIVPIGASAMLSSKMSKAPR